jgi:purine-binding chemotaxis protein CheW
MNTSQTMNTRATELRDAFDQAFAQPASHAPDAIDALLTIAVAGDQYALRLTEVAGMFADKKITWLPSAMTELRGIAGFRGMVLPVYDLSMLLGYPRAAEPRWLVVTAGTPVGLAFDGFTGYVNAQSTAIAPEATVYARERHIREVFQSEIVRPIIHLPSVLDTIRNRSGHDGLL